MLTTKQLSSFPANSNPFNHDAYHMGTQLGSNCVVMHENHISEECKYLIIVNTATGERVKVAFEEKHLNPTLVDTIVNSIK